MAIYRVFSDADGESHIEDLNLAEHPELGALLDVSEVRVQEFDGSRNMDFHPLPERRLVIHLSGEVEIGASDGAKRVLRAWLSARSASVSTVVTCRSATTWRPPTQTSVT